MGNKFTWTNKQVSPLLERLDWFFASTSWITNYLGSFASTLSRDVSDHSPCLISFSTDIPKAECLGLKSIGCFMMISWGFYSMVGIFQSLHRTKQKI
jgi:hypothetical protein